MYLHPVVYSTLAVKMAPKWQATHNNTYQTCAGIYTSPRPCKSLYVLNTRTCPQACTAGTRMCVCALDARIGSYYAASTTPGCSVLASESAGGIICSSMESLLAVCSILVVELVLGEMGKLFSLK
ncbi:hypothetical protein V8C42DRAFT_303500 [Trichoderma barbatum]